MMLIVDDGPDRDEGTVVVFYGYDMAGVVHYFGVDHRQAEVLADAVIMTGEVEVDVPDWAIL